MFDTLRKWSIPIESTILTLINYTPTVVAVPDAIVMEANNQQKIKEQLVLQPISKPASETKGQKEESEAHDPEDHEYMASEAQSNIDTRLIEDSCTKQKLNTTPTT